MNRLPARRACDWVLRAFGVMTLDAIPSCNQRGRRPHWAHDCIAERGIGRPHRVGKSSHIQERCIRGHWTTRHRRRRSDCGAIHEPACLPAHTRYSVVGVVLSLEVLSTLGTGFLLFGNQLFDRRLWGSCSSNGVASDWFHRSSYGCADVRSFCRPAVCYCEPAGSIP